MTCMTVAEAIEEARTYANASGMSEACFHRLDAARALADEVERLRLEIQDTRNAVKLVVGGQHAWPEVNDSAIESFVDFIRRQREAAEAAKGGKGDA